MRRLIITAALALLATAAQAQDQTPRSETLRTRWERIDAVTWILTEKATGCQYLVIDEGDAGGMTPRLGEDRQPICGPAASQ